VEEQDAPRITAIDTGAIFAIADQSDSWHVPCNTFVDSYKGKLIVPCPVVPEVCYFLNRYLGPKIEGAFLKSLSQGEVVLDHFPDDDLQRCRQLMEKYANLNLGFVDAAVIAMCERRKISAILTTDRKHFSVVRSKLGIPFRLLP
jgi:predicted nucleic acid-binding protein